MNAMHDLWSKLGPDIVRHTGEHIVLTVVALAIAIAISVPTGVFLARCRIPALVSSILGAVGIVQTVPSLALIAFIVVVFAFVSLPTIGVPPSLVALVLYALLPILRNTYTGIRQVDPAITEVARGMGMKPGQVLFKVELPLALPVIMAGVRIATVWTIGVACLCSLVGGGGLGDLIMRGLRSIQSDYILAGTIPAAALALVFDFGLGTFERVLTPRGMRNQGKAS
jgi:osmoprotectant transport system permease protein